MTSNTGIRGNQCFNIPAARAHHRPRSEIADHIDIRLRCYRQQKGEVRVIATRCYPVSRCLGWGLFSSRAEVQIPQLPRSGSVAIMICAKPASRVVAGRRCYELAGQVACCTTRRAWVQSKHFRLTQCPDPSPNCCSAMKTRPPTSAKVAAAYLLTEWPRFHRPTESFPSQPQSIEVLLRGSH